MFAGFFMGEQLAYAAASAIASSMQSQSMDSYVAQNAAAMTNAKPSSHWLVGLANSYRPTVGDRDRWMRRRLGIPDVSEDIQ